jgi:hypothetical protein
MLEMAVRFSLLAFSTPGFASDEHLSGTQPHTGAAMSLMKQSDVKDDLSPGDRSKIHLCESMSLPDATGYSMAEPNATEASLSVFTRNYSVEHTNARISSRPTTNSIGSTEPNAPEASKSSQP